MGHPFGDLIRQHLHRKHGLSQSKLAAGILQAPTVISGMCKGQRLTGPQARERVLAIIRWLHQHEALTTTLEANNLLYAAGMSSLDDKVSAEATLRQQLQGQRRTPVAQQRPVAAALLEQVTTFVGREKEQAQITHLLTTGHCRLLTLVGPGGVGKTRLALHVATALQAHFTDGVYFAALAALHDPTLVINTVTQLLRVREKPGDQPLLEQLVEHLHSRHTLLVLDNFEHLLPAAPLLATLLAFCPRLQIVATSREALHLQGEQEYPVPALTLPTVETGLVKATALQYEAIQLFVQRAQAVQPTFVCTPENTATIVKICAHLDGLPLALELAAARVKLLPPAMLLQQITSTMGARFALLKNGVRDAPARHQTLHQAIDWSYALLTPAEQALLRRLAIFVGGWTLTAAEAICRDATSGSDQSTLLDLLASLVDKSLVYQNENAQGEARFGLLETIREYGVLRLQEQDELSVLQRVHACYFVTYAERTAETYCGPNESFGLTCLANEAGNLDAAYAWIITNQATTLGLRFGAAMWHFWDRRGQMSEGRRKLAALMALPGAADDNQRLAAVLIGAGLLAEGKCDYPAAFAALETCLTLASAVEDRRLMIYALNALGQAKRAQGEYAQAQRYYEQSVAIARRLDDQSLLADCLEVLAIIVHLQHHDDMAQTLCAEGLALAKAVNNTATVTDILFVLAWIARNRGNYASADVYLNESINRTKEITIDYQPHHCECIEYGMIALSEQAFVTARRWLQQGLRSAVVDYHYWGIAYVFESMAIVAATAKQGRQAFLLAGAAHALRRLTHTAPYSHTADHLKAALASLSPDYSHADAAAAQLAGEQMTLDEAIAFALVA